MESARTNTSWKLWFECELFGESLSERVQAEYLLQAARPSNLPSDDAGMGCPIQNVPRLAAQPSLLSETTTGKGRGSHVAGVMPTATRPTGGISRFADGGSAAGKR